MYVFARKDKSDYTISLHFIKKFRHETLSNRQNMTKNYLPVISIEESTPIKVQFIFRSNNQNMQCSENKSFPECMSRSSNH